MGGDNRVNEKKPRVLAAQYCGCGSGPCRASRRITISREISVDSRMWYCYMYDKQFHGIQKYNGKVTWEDKKLCLFELKSKIKQMKGSKKYKNFFTNCVLPELKREHKHKCDECTFFAQIFSSKHKVKYTGDLTTTHDLLVYLRERMLADFFFNNTVGVNNRRLCDMIKTVDMIFRIYPLELEERYDDGYYRREVDFPPNFYVKFNTNLDNK